MSTITHCGRGFDAASLIGNWVRANQRSLLRFVFMLLLKAADPPRMNIFWLLFMSNQTYRPSCILSGRLTSRCAVRNQLTCSNITEEYEEELRADSNVSSETEVLRQPSSSDWNFNASRFDGINISVRLKIRLSQHIAGVRRVGALKWRCDDFFHHH